MRSLGFPLTVNGRVVEGPVVIDHSPSAGQGMGAYASYHVGGRGIDSPPGALAMPREAAGVPSPYVPHVHPYPTRFHGGVWKVPRFGFPVTQAVEANFKRDDFATAPRQRPVATSGLSGAGGGCACGSLYDTEAGTFRRPSSGGGGIFNRAISGEEEAAPAKKQGGGTSTVLLATVGAAVGFGATWWLTGMIR